MQPNDTNSVVGKTVKDHAGILVFDQLPKPLRVLLSEAALDYSIQDAYIAYSGLVLKFQNDGYGPAAPMAAMQEMRRIIQMNDAVSVWAPHRELLANPRSIFVDVAPPA